MWITFQPYGEVILAVVMMMIHRCGGDRVLVHVFSFPGLGLGFLSLFFSCLSGDQIEMARVGGGSRSFPTYMQLKDPCAQTQEEQCFQALFIIPFPPHLPQ